VTRHLAGLIVLVVAGVVASTAAAAPPQGATARCSDGTYSYSTHRSGTCSHHGGVAVWLTAAAAPPPRVGFAVGRTVLLRPRSRTLHCVRGVRPDRRCSPGAISAGLTRNVICSPRFRTSAIRNVPESVKFAVERAYGMPPRHYGHSIEIDHIVSLELGGSNDIANLYPEPGTGTASYHAKDQLENRLHDMVCNGEMTLRAAQRGIAGDWVALYRRVFAAPPIG